MKNTSAPLAPHGRNCRYRGIPCFAIAIRKPNEQAAAKSTTPTSPMARCHELGTLLPTVSGNAARALPVNSSPATNIIRPTVLPKNGNATKASQARVMVTIRTGILSTAFSICPGLKRNQRDRTIIDKAKKAKNTELTIAVNSCVDTVTKAKRTVKSLQVAPGFVNVYNVTDKKTRARV